MPRLIGVDIPHDKRIIISLQYIHGLGGHSAARVLEAGVTRLVLGTSAVEEPRLVKHLCREYADEAIVGSLDARNGLVAVRGWKETTAVPALELLRQMAALGVKRFVYTDIARDGTLTEPNWEALTAVLTEARALEVALISSGGISSVDHVKRLAALGVEAAIIGRALYTGALSLQNALSAAAA